MSAARFAQYVEKWHAAPEHSRDAHRELVLCGIRTFDDATKAQILDLLIGTTTISFGPEWGATRQKIAEIAEDVVLTQKGWPIDAE